MEPPLRWRSLNIVTISAVIVLYQTKPTASRYLLSQLRQPECSMSTTGALLHIIKLCKESQRKGRMYQQRAHLSAKSPLSTKHSRSISRLKKGSLTTWNNTFNLSPPTFEAKGVLINLQLLNLRHK
jgi:hypothetical protein